MRAISAPTSAARFSKFSGQFSAQIWSCWWCAARASRCCWRSSAARECRRVRRGTARRRSDIPPFRRCDGDVQSSRCALDAASTADGIVAGEEARLQLADPIPALGESPESGLLVESGARSDASSNSRIVEGAEFRRQPAQRPDQPELRGDDVNDRPEPRLLRECEAMLGFALHLGERIARREKVRDSDVAQL